MVQYLDTPFGSMLELFQLTPISDLTTTEVKFMIHRFHQFIFVSEPIVKLQREFKKQPPH